MFSASVARSVSIVSESLGVMPPLPTRPPLWRLNHDNPVRDIVIRRNVPLPEVFPMFPNGYFPLNREWQLLWKGINPALSKLKWRALLGWTVAFTNDQGFDKPGDPRIDYVNGMGVGSPLPKMELLLCGGAVVTGHVEGAWLYVDTLDGWASPPDPMWVIERPWYWFTAVSINPQGEINNLPQGGGTLAKRVPIVSRYPVKIALSKLRKLGQDEPIPSPYS